MSDYQRLQINQYEQDLIQQAYNSKLSFHDIDTPGWSSMVQHSQVLTENSQPRSRNSFEINGDKSAKFDGKDISNRIYIKSKPKRNSVLTDMNGDDAKNRTPLSLVERENMQPESYKPTIGLKERIQMKLQGFSFNSEPDESITHSHFTITEECKSKQNVSKSKMSFSNRSESQKILQKSISSSQVTKKKYVPIEKKLQIKPKQSRFKQITVHQHLYQTSKKLEQKKEVKKMLDEQFHSAYVAPFQPVINLRSSRMADKINSGQYESKKVKEEATTLTTIAEEKSKTEIKKQIDENQVKLFNFLSKEGSKINQQTLNKGLETLPLPCVSLLSKFIKTVYSDTTYDLADFQKVLRNKKIVTNREKLLKCFQRWQNTE